MKEIIALISKGVIFIKSIRLEFFDETDFNDMYKAGAIDMLWPKSPFVEISHNVVDESVYNRIERAYQLACKYDPNQMLMSKWWTKMSEEFQKYLFEDSGKLRKEYLMNFRCLRSADAQIITDQLWVVNKDIGYVKSYLNAIDLVLEYHRFAQIVKNETLASLSESYAGNNLCPVYRGKRLSYRLLTNAIYLQGILKNVDFVKREKNIVVEIGGGYGSLLRLLNVYLSGNCYVMVELPEVACLASYFLSYCFPDKKIAFLQDIIELDQLKEAFDIYDIIILPPWCMEKIPTQSTQLVINTMSLGEMSKEYGTFYLRHIERILKKRGYFYSVNRLYADIDGYDDFGFFNWPFKERYLTLSYKHLPLGYPEWIGQKLN
ncbi:MAG: putative sugar O-methyltransferase [Candidatus Omnitrophica bacterium]|nr:putative sugar O-methyltransferase [Candidatus Omnitrophota bacterium]